MASAGSSAATSSGPERWQLPGVLGELLARLSAGQQMQIGVDHHGDQLVKTDLRLPAELVPRLARVRAELVDLGRPDERRVGDHVVAPVQPGGPERGLYQR